MIPPKEMILEFVDALLEEARQEAREEMIKELQDDRMTAIRNFNI